MRPQLLFRKAHRWLGLVLGIQILFWFASGFLMSVMPIDEVRGEHLFKQKEQSSVVIDQIDLGKIAAQINERILSAEIKSLLNQTIVAIKTQNSLYLFNAQTSELISPISVKLVINLLKSQLKPEHDILDIQKLETLPNEARGRELPLWQVQLSGPENPKIYVSAQSGEIVATRTDRWRIFDFVWMLHIMDYNERSDFNHPLLYLTALSAFLFTLTGFVLLFFTLIKRKTISSSV